MKRTLLATLSIFAIAFSIGCEDKISQSDLDRQKKTIADAKKTVQTEEQQLVVMKERKELEGKMETEMVALVKTIDNLEVKAGQAEGERQVELRKEIAGLRTKYDQMKRKLDELKAATGDTWAAAKLSAEEAWNDLKSSVKKTTDSWGDK